ncbi:MAG TPA: FkbM family methyltransferase [Elusimicrobiota bacterium]|nr:FkbM family methyltransferase [Elusimicrobiota bacterium]
MAISEAIANIKDNYRFHLSVRGGRMARLGYLTLYYFIFIFFRRGDRHLRALTWLKRMGLSDVMVDVASGQGLKLKMDLHTAYDPLYAIHGRRDYAVSGFEPKPGETVLDLGANVGVYSALAARAVGAGGTVVAVEPHPGNCRLLRENIARNGLKQVRIVEAAVDERPGRAELFVHERAINHSLVRRTGRSVSVRVASVDELVQDNGLSRVDIIKIDTEGNVAEILRGASGTIGRFHPRITLEYESGEGPALRAQLKSYGYGMKVDGAIGYAVFGAGSERENT